MKKLILLLLSTNLYACKEESLEEATTKTYCHKTKIMTTKYYKKEIKPDYFCEIKRTTKERCK